LTKDPLYHLSEAGTRGNETSYPGSALDGFAGIGECRMESASAIYLTIGGSAYPD